MVLLLLSFSVLEKTQTLTDLTWIFHNFCLIFYFVFAYKKKRAALSLEIFVEDT